MSTTTVEPRKEELPVDDLPQSEPFWRYRFHSQEALVKALEEYCSLHPGIVAIRPEDLAGTSATTKAETKVLCQNWEIDRMMIRLQAVAPFYHRVLDLYYRRPWFDSLPPCYQNHGWEATAKRVGLPCLKRHRYRRRQFEQILDWAIGALFLERNVRH